MAADSHGAYIKSAKQTSYIVNHVFLPSKVPQEDDYEVEHEEALLEAVLETLFTFKDYVQDSDTSVVDSIINSLKTLHSFTIEEQLLEAFEEYVIKKHGTTVFHVKKQNAGIMFTRSDASVHIETFELSADNKSVMSTRGRLRRLFPGSSAALPLETFQLQEFQDSVADTLVKMSQQTAHGTQPQVKKANKMHDEDRDTTHPKMVTDFFSAVMSFLGRPVDVACIRKHTREEIFWQDCRSPWRRSALWLLIRVALQLQFSRSAISDLCPDQAYKTYMLFFMADILNRAHEFNLPSDVLSAMSSKLSRRCQKVAGFVPGSIIQFVESSLLVTSQILQERWSQIQRKNHLSHNMERLRDLDFEGDTHIHLPKLDVYIGSIDRRGEDSDKFSLNMDCPLDTYLPFMVPCFTSTSDPEDMAYKLSAVEFWVAENLPVWINKNAKDPKTCSALRPLILNYFRAALDQYKGNPETTSIMVLTILELWVACDRSAVQICSLLKKYNPGIPVGLLENLNLPLKKQMERLQKLEEYLLTRESQANYTSYDVFQNFGGIHSFSVQYFDQSAEHQELLAVIEENARRAREEKRNEFREKRCRYQDLMQSSEAIEHTTIATIDQYTGYWSSKCTHNCNKCQLKQLASSLEIEIHEWPVPQNESQARAIVFELRVPLSFGHWRDITTFILLNVLGKVYQNEKKPAATNVLGKGLLANYFRRFDQDQRMILLSELKSHTRTHRRMREIITQTEDDICLQNGLQYRYFDDKMGCFVANLKDTLVITELCTYSLLESTGQTSPLQKFINRPASEPNGPPPNTVLASQSTCPSNLSLEEYKALTSIPLGSNIQWQNILVQLALPSVDFKLEETVFVILQCIFQAGPPKKDDVLREGHKILSDKRFALALLGSLAEALERVKENWQSFQALGVFVAIARRLLSLAPMEDVRHMCLEFLAVTRHVSLRWIEVLEDKIQETTDDDIRADLLHKLTRIALICTDTFNVDDEHLRHLLASTDQAYIMIRCAISIQEGLCHVVRATKGLTLMMHQRWERLSYRGFSILSDQIVNKNNLALNNAIMESWPAFHPNNEWLAMPSPYHHWLNTCSAREGGASRWVHFSLLTGELLIDGSPLSRLPKEYEQDPMYSTLFGMSIIEVVPSSVSGMRFSSKKAFNGHRVDFGLSHSNKNLAIRAVAEGQTFELVPRRILQSSFPTMFVDNFVHWYNKSGGYLEFCAQELPWTHSDKNWRLFRSGTADGWRLVKGNSFLVNMNSDTAAGISKILFPLENAVWTHVILHGVSLDIELPRLKLGFHMRKGETSISSRQFRGMLVDEDQSIGTLIGLHTKLVLRGQDGRLRRKVIIPSGDITISKELQHVRVEIEHCLTSKVHSYEVDDLLGRLINNSSLQSRLLISYLHALTSFPLPDPLTGKTGTEHAFTILNSAAVRSFKWLNEEDIDLLVQISKLTPQRVYYPEYKQVMQSVEWSSNLDFLAQHGEFYRSVNSIFNQALESEFLYPERCNALPHLHKVEHDLLRRDLIRSSSFRIPGFGAEHHTDKYDVDYEARDREEYSSQASHAVGLSGILFEESFRLQCDIPEDIGTHIWNFISRHAKGPIHGPTIVWTVPPQLKYDSRFLLEPSNFIAKHWITLHQLLSTPSARPNIYQMMFWFGTIAFAKDVDLIILQILASFYAAPEMVSIAIPRISESSFDLSYGFGINDSKLKGTIRESCHAFHECPEADLTRDPGESKKVFRRRQEQLFLANKEESISTLTSALKAQWPCEVPNPPNSMIRANLNLHVDVDEAMGRAKDTFKRCFHNLKLLFYFQDIGKSITWKTSNDEILKMAPNPPPLSPVAMSGFVGDGDVFSFVAPTILPYAVEDVISPTYSESQQTPRLPYLLSRLEEQAQSGYESNYVADLRSSVESLQNWRKEYSLPLSTEEIEVLLVSHRDVCQIVVDGIYTIMCDAVKTSLRERSASSQHWPRISPTFFLERLSRRYWEDLPEGWKMWIVQYGVAVSQLQRADRLLRAIHNPSALIRELRNPGHTNWEPLFQPDSLLLEIESDLMIRQVQEQIAGNMRSPETGRNAVMQLNMGEGKSSVIVPAVAAALADGSRIVRVVVGKPQSKQMFQMLVSKLGGMLGRRVYHMPFSRAVRVGRREIQAMIKILNSCSENGGVFLVQPEHILSFKLMGIECILTGKEKFGRPLAELQEMLNIHTRDIVDESDENFSVKFELVYTMGTQRPTEYSPERWSCVQQLLDVVRNVISKVYTELPGSIELRFQASGCFPWTRIIRPDAADRILLKITEQICATGLNGFPITRQPLYVRRAVYKYITEVEPSAEDIALVEDPSPNGFWTGASQTLLLLRGLIAGGVLAFAFGHKRWRVDYGLDANRNPTTKLAVPYRAKDSPSPRSEFSHPDVVILLTSLSYYYGGLSDEDLLLTFNHLFKSDQAELEYGLWARDANGLDPAFRQLVGINLEDTQCTQHVFKNLRYVKGVVDYFLAYIVFPKEMKEFPHKLSASGWDLGEVKTHPTTGFSGTNDSRKVLPLHVEQLDLEAQKHTNALVLEYLLQPENSVALMPPRREIDVSVAEMLLDIITRMEPPTRVILDVGAQILELDNLGVATTWLRRNSHDAQIQAAVYFDDHDELCVLDRKGHSEPLQASPFATQLDVCLVFLDEAHTRGTDLKLPRDYRAAVTLGANLTKDRLVQACMRMRMLGEGQSVVFCVPEEIQAKIRARGSSSGLPADKEITVLDILAWTIGETWQDIHRSMGLWANQGRRHEEHLKIWEEVRAQDQAGKGIVFGKSLAEKYLEDESQTLERRYRPHTKDTNTLGSSSDKDAMDPISLRCREFANLNLDSATLQEEEERELSPEIEQEREDQRPPAAKPDTHSIHKDIKSFVLWGVIGSASQGYRSAFTALRYTTAGALFDVSKFPPRLLVSNDFERTIRHGRGPEALDFYQRTVQWVLTSGPRTKVEHMMVISPFEAQELLPMIQESSAVALHLYAPQSSLGYRRLDTLDLYTVPESLSTRQIPERLITELNLFAGQLYFNSFEQYIDACKFLGISWDTPGEGEEIAADGFILRDATGRVGGESGLPYSPVKFFKMLHTKIRRNCESISKTHMGKLLDNQLLKPEDFEKKDG
ncbi:hypothetical protein F4781DRAFT_395603 [Annulohypoxylon bovei var. microspora]|nr:hypothetical protein F4781DRAFT_395603 [Annulohypoxylon bovei var. microspora]